MRFDEQYVSIPRLALAGAERFPEGEAIVDGDVRITYPQLADEVIRSTRAAVAAGIEPGDRVAIWAPNSYKWILAALGALGAGAAHRHPQHPLQGHARRRSCSRSPAPAMLFTDNGFLGNDYAAMLRDALAETGETLDDLDRIVVPRWRRRNRRQLGPTTSPRVSRCPKPTRTRGSTRFRPTTSPTSCSRRAPRGSPKGAMSTHAQNLRVYEVWSEVVGLREGDRYLVVNPFFHGFGYKAGWFASILRGATIVPMAVFDVPAVMEKVQEERITFLPGPPTLLFGLLEFPDRDQYDLSSLRTTVTGAAVVPVELVEAAAHAR